MYRGRRPVRSLTFLQQVGALTPMEWPGAGRWRDGVGRSTIREAMRSLAGQDLVTTTRGVAGGASSPRRASGLELITAPVFRVLSSRFGRDLTPEGFWECVDSDHRAILDAVTSGDSMAAMDLMRRHLDHLQDSYRQMDRLRS